MARAFIGNFKGPKGDKGDDGTQGKQGDTGATGQRGSRWSEGPAITGTSTTATVFSGTGITDALANDMYMNTSSGNVYRCTTGGAADTAKWVFVGNIKGVKGDKGNKGDKGEKGDKGDKGETGATGATGASGTADTTFTEAPTLTKLTSGESFKTMLGKIAKAVSTVFNKLDKSSVVNNNTTTQAGFALDARQANPNIEGTMAANILQLNNDSNLCIEKVLSIIDSNLVTSNRAGCFLLQNRWIVITGEVDINFENIQKWTNNAILKCSVAPLFRFTNFVITDEDGYSYIGYINSDGIINFSVRGHIPENKNQILRFYCIAFATT